MDDAIYFSAETMGFYSAAVHGDALPADAVRISRVRHAELLASQAEGRVIAADKQGRPVIAPLPREAIDTLRLRVTSRAKNEARRRILLVASLEQQSNDNALIALAVLDGNAQAPGVMEARGRRRAIDALRARSNDLEARLARMTRGALEAFDPTRDEYWS